MSDTSHRSLATLVCQNNDRISRQIDRALKDGVSLRQRIALLRNLPWAVGAVLDEENLYDWVNSRVGAGLPEESSLVHYHAQREDIVEMVKVCAMIEYCDS
jgi:hypothetical protein